MAGVHRQPLLVFVFVVLASATASATRHFSIFSSATAQSQHNAGANVAVDDATSKDMQNSASSAPSSSSPSSSSTQMNPFTAKAATLRYWDRKLPNGRLRPEFLVSKLSPLSSLDEATFSVLVAGDLEALTPRLPALCSSARLLCNDAATADSSSIASHSHHGDSNFANYDNINFRSYGGNGAVAGLDSFRNYSLDLNIPVDSFRRYSHGSDGHDDSFSTYSTNGNVVTTNFTSYGGSATDGTGSFSTYQRSSNIPNLDFSNYNADANGRKQGFTSYADQTNSGGQSFSGYGKRGNGVTSNFSSYASDSNTVTSNFANYGEHGNSATDTFTRYGEDGNIPETGFRSYGSGGNAGTESFTSYRNVSNAGDDTFQSYGKGGNDPTLQFANYGNSFNEGSDRFKSYAQGAKNNPTVDFKGYADNNTDFKGYNNHGATTFKDYKNSSVVPNITGAATGATVLSASFAAALEKTKQSHRWVEPGKFFRESSLREGTVMPMPDIRDKMPARSFLPRSISVKLPFRHQEELRRVFSSPADTALGKAIGDTVSECERPPSKGETKRCAASAEDMIDFASAVIGDSAVARSTESAAGSGGLVMLGKVTGIDGGKVTGAVSCHQSLFPYLVYYCHSVPKVRVYEAEILTVDSKEKINHGVAICHLDTSDWSAGHGAFLALGPAPGKIEVCHWIFQGDMTWTVSR